MTVPPLYSVLIYSKSVNPNAWYNKLVDIFAFNLIEISLKSTHLYDEPEINYKLI